MDPLQDIKLKDAVATILDRYPNTRDNDKELVLRCLYEFEGWHKMMDEDTFHKLIAWARRDGTHGFETWRRRRQEIQRNRNPQAGYLRPSEGVALYRQQRDGAGPPRRRK